MATVRIYRLAVTHNGQEFSKSLIRRVMLETEVGAKAILAGGRYSHGNLARSVHGEGPVVRGPIVVGSVGSKLKYALIVHNGSGLHGPKHKPYSIFPKGAPHVYRFGSHHRPQLKFFWRKVGHTVYMPHIPGSAGKVGLSHPGQKGKHYLTEPMRASARRHRFRVFIQDV
jgi:hypothetical protein